MADAKQATETVCEHCGEEIVQVLVGWVHYDSGNPACALYAAPRTHLSQTELRIPDDLKELYAMQKKVLRCFREDKDAVANAGRTMGLIERIARLEGG